MAWKVNGECEWGEGRQKGVLEAMVGEKTLKHRHGEENNVYAKRLKLPGHCAVGLRVCRPTYLLKQSQ